MRTNLPLLTCVALLATVAQSQERYAAFLSGDHELPPIASPGSGEARLTLNAVVNTLSYHLEVSGITGTAAHIHLGDRSTSGGVVFPLSGGPTLWRGTTPPLSAAQLAALDARGLYMNVHTLAQPGGEIRGQILAARQLLLYSELSGAEEVPPVVSPARGQAALVLDLQREVLHYDLRTSGLAASAAHIHSAAVGSNGGVSFPLAGGPVNFAGTTPTLSPAQVDALLSGGMYVNVHTAANPGGEIRGQVFRIGSRPEFAAELDGSQEVPPVATAGNASARLQLLLPDNTLRYELAATSLSSAPIAAHIHLGSTGVGGPVVFTLNGFLTRWCGVTPTLTPEQVLSLLIGDYYTNVHTAMHPGGEIRGQVFPALPRSFSARLDGAQEVPPVATAAGGVARIDLDPGSGVLRYDLRARGLTGTAAHVHLGAAGSNGPVAFPLSGGPTRFSGATAALTAPQIATLRTAGFYVNVHTAANPGGEIRGQVQVATAGMRFGTGCAGSSGRAAAISLRGLPRIGDAPVFELAGAASSQPAALALGASSVLFAGAVPLPLDLGFGNCTLWVDPAILTSLVTDANGCNAIALPIPGEPRLVGQEIFAQWLFVDPGANLVGIALSDALEVAIES